MKFKLLIAALIFNYSVAMPIASEVKSDDDGEGKGILDGFGQAGATTTKAPAGGLNLPGALSTLSNTGPILILGGFQAIVTKFDPSLVQGLPGISSLPIGK